MGLAKSLDGKNAIVTGSGNGIGRAIAMRFAAEGARVTVADIEEDAGRETVDRIAKAGGTAIFVRTDTTDSDAIKAAVAATIAAHDEIDVLVNNAAAFVFGKEFAGTVKLSGSSSPMKPQLLINDKPDKSDTLNQFVTVGYKFYSAAKTLNPKFGVMIKASKTSF